MNDDLENNTPSRREADKKFDEIIDCIDAIKATQKKHVEEYHAFKVAELRVLVAQHESLIESVPINTKLLEKIVNVLEGSEEFDMHDESMGRTGGMVAKQKAMDKRQVMMEQDIADFKYEANGGKGFSVRNKDKLIIGAIASVPTIASLIIAAIAVNQSGATP